MKNDDFMKIALSLFVQYEIKAIIMQEDRAQSFKI